MPHHETGGRAVVLLHTEYEWIHFFTFIYIHLLFLKHCDHSILQSPEESGLGMCCVVFGHCSET